MTQASCELAFKSDFHLATVSAVAPLGGGDPRVLRKAVCLSLNNSGVMGCTPATSWAHGSAVLWGTFPRQRHLTTLATRVFHKSASILLSKKMSSSFHSGWHQAGNCCTAIVRTARTAKTARTATRTAPTARTARTAWTRRQLWVGKDCLDQETVGRLPVLDNAELASYKDNVDLKSYGKLRSYKDLKTTRSKWTSATRT